MNNSHSFLARLRRSPIPWLAAVMLLASAWSSLAFGGEIHEAAKAGDLEKIKALLKDNPELVFSKDTNGATSLHAAAAIGHKDVAELLLAHKAEVNAKENDGATPLHVAACEGHKDVVKLLLANEAEANAKDNNSRTPLAWATHKSHENVAELLRQHGGQE